MGIIITVDMGGTQMRVASYMEGTTTPVKIHRMPTQALKEAIIDRLMAAIEVVWPKEPVTSLSVAVPGPLDPTLGIVHSTPNIPGWKNFPLGAKLASRFHVPVFLENDANLAALGERSYGIGQGYDDLIYFTISTGIGGGVISNGHLLSGAHGLAAELGHVTVLSDGPVCSCGQRGHLEAISSGTGIARYVRESISSGRISSLTGKDTITSRDVSLAAQEGDPLSLEAFDYAGRYLGLAIADYLHIFNPSMLIFGGGVSRSHGLFFPAMKESMSSHLMDPAYLEDLRLELAMLGDDAGLLGALAYARMKLS